MIPGKEFEEISKSWEYLKLNMKSIRRTEKVGKWKGARWYAYSRTQNLTEFDQSKF